MIYTLYLVDDNNNITETISLDVINSFGEDYSSNIAQNAVENGYIISDSISISNPKFSIGGVITDSKFRVKGHLVVFDGNTFAKSQGDNGEQFQQISDDDYADKVKERLIKLWENKEVFGILESKDITNVKGSQVRNIFPCVLSSLSFNKSDAAAAIYPNMSIEKIRYAVVTVGTVKNPTPELIPKYEEQKENVGSNSNSVAANVKSSGAKDIIAEAVNDGKSVLNGINGEQPKTAAQNGYTTRTVVDGSYADANKQYRELKTDPPEGRKAWIDNKAKQIFESRRDMLADKDAVFKTQ